MIQTSSFQAQVAHIGSSLHYRTPYVLRVPMATDVRIIFWGINGVLLLILPQLFAYRCVQSPEFFVPTKNQDSRRGKAEWVV